NLRQELIRDDRDVWLLEASGPIDVNDLIRGDRPSDDLPDSIVQFIIGLAVSSLALRDVRTNSLEEADVILNVERILVRDSQRKRLRQFRDRVQEARLAVLQAIDVVLCRRKYRNPFRGVGTVPTGP